MGARLTAFGRYEVLGVAGEGGMGRVYRARDEKLGRLVAVKVLPAEFRDDPARLRRFEREARAVARISHPNVLMVHDVGEQNGEPYLVTELLEGVTLRERLKEGPLPRAEAIDIAVQVARGLAVAHEAGLVHRDIKPSNLFVCKDGYVKILDFGIATHKAAGNGTQTESALTREGAPIGSLGYMAPEQIRGRPVDARTDLFALGTVLYEMVAGARPFAGDTDIEIAVATLQDAHERLDDEALDAVVGRCLAKAAAERYASANELSKDLEALAAEAPPAVALKVTPARALARRGRRLFRWLFPAVALAGAAGAGGVMYWRADSADSAEAPPRRPARAVDLAEDRITRAPDPIWRHGVSQDGKTIAYMQKTKTFVRPLAGGQPRQLVPPDEYDAVTPFDFLPGGDRLMVLLVHDGFVGESALAIYDLRDDSIEILHEQEQIGDTGRLTRDGSRFAFTGPGGIYTIDIAGGTARLLVPVAKPARARALAWSPDGAHLAYIHTMPTEQTGLVARLLVTDADGVATRRLPTSNLNQLEDTAYGMEWYDETTIVYGQAGSELASSELWGIGVAGGAWDGAEPRPLFRFASGVVDHFRRGGDRLFFIKNQLDHKVLMLELDEAGNAATEPVSISASDGAEFVGDMTPSGALLLFSNRHGSFDIYRRSPEGDEELVVGTEEQEWWPTAAGEAVLYWVERDGWVLSRIEPGQKSGTLLRQFKPGARPQLDCANQLPDRCVLSERIEGELVVHRIDPHTGQSGELVFQRSLTEVVHGMQLNPSGTRGLVPLKRQTPTLALVDLADHRIAELPFDGIRMGGASVMWMSDEQFAFAAQTGGVPYWLGLGDLEGNAREIYRSENVMTYPLVVYPGGRRIVFTMNVLDIEQWAIDGL